MFGSEYARYPEVLTDSFKKMKDDYAAKATSFQKQSFIRKLMGYYVALFGIPEIGFQVRSFHFIESLKSLKSTPKTILDAGTGIGAYAIFLHKKYPKAKIDGVDIDKDKIQFCKYFVKNEHIQNTQFQYKNIVTKNPGTKRYDLIVNVDVLEHIRNYKQVLKNFSKLLNGGGYLFIHTPHNSQKRFFKASENWHHEDHVREGFTKQELVRELEKVGLKVVIAYQSFSAVNRLTWEINHILLAKNFIIAGIIYPLLSLAVPLDTLFRDSNGWGIVLLARKIKK